MIIGSLLCEAGTALRAAGIPDPRREARLLLAHVLHATPEALLRDATAAVEAAPAARFRGLVARRAAREPVARLLGVTGFWTLELEVGIDTLLPRADSEVVVEAALEISPAPRRVLDLGTGTGCLLLAVLAERPGAWGLGLDLRPGAAALAARNATRNGLALRAAFAAGDWAGAVQARFDLVLSNPPYIPSGAIPALMPEVALHEPASALDGGADGLAAYRIILGQLPRLLEPHGHAVLELGQGQASEVRALAALSGLECQGMHRDLGGIERAIILAPIGGGRKAA